jgi:signal transduction histidine kinase
MPAFTGRTTRHAKSHVRIAAHGHGKDFSIVVEDDGFGVASYKMASALERGIRLDQRGGGAGLGMLIVQDVLEAYRWSLTLEVSELGGPKAECRPAD